MKRGVTRTLIALLSFWLTSFPEMSGGESVDVMSGESTAPACDEEWVCQLIAFLDANSSPSGALLLERASHDPNSTQFLIRTLDSLPSLGEKGQEILSQALASKNPAIRDRAAKLHGKTGADLQP
jgi:hypothetical protein